VNSHWVYECFKMKHSLTCCCHPFNSR